MTSAITTTAPAAGADTEERNRLVRQLILKNAGDDQLRLVLAICDRYGFDPLLRHIALIAGSLYVTRDGLLHVAHASGQLDGIEVAAEQDEEGCWAATVKVHRKDMAHPFVYTAYQKEHQNPASPAWRNSPRAMTVKCAEVMALRRAFDVSLTAAEEVGYDPATRRSRLGPAMVVEAAPSAEDEAGDAARRAAVRAWIAAGKLTLADANRAARAAHGRPLRDLSPAEFAAVHATIEAHYARPDAADGDEALTATFRDTPAA
jgi:hypothetical protein